MILEQAYIGEYGHSSLLVSHGFNFYMSFYEHRQCPPYLVANMSALASFLLL